MFVLVIAFLAFSAIKPALNLMHSYRQVSETRERLHSTLGVADRLERRVKHLRGDTVLTREARRQGMIEPGENAWVVSGTGP